MKKTQGQSVMKITDKHKQNENKSDDGNSANDCEPLINLTHKAPLQKVNK
jgi:hypothetical protein